MVLVIDNYDSFTFNLVQYLGMLGVESEVYLNDQISLRDIEVLDPQHILISPGPCTPYEAGVSVAVIKHFSGKVPILGVCLGHQAIASAFGGSVVRARRVMHGKVSSVYHQNHTIFSSLPSPFVATRYHSLIVDKPLPRCLSATAWTGEDELMGLAHRDHPTFGVQFHPESILTEHGHTMLKNFLEVSL